MRAQNGKTNIGLILRALRHRNYRLFFAGQSISLVGTWMQAVALGWLVYRLTNSPFLLGVIGFSSQICAFFVAPLAGVLLDRWSRHRVIVGTQTLAMLQAFTLAFLTLSNSLEIWHVIVLSTFIGLVNAFDLPARQSFVVEMVEGREDLSNAIALNSFLFNGARVFGPTIAGIIISLAGALVFSLLNYFLFRGAHVLGEAQAGTVVAVAGSGICFFLNGLSYIAVIAALLAMRVKLPERQASHRQFLSGLREGVSYAFHFKPVRMLLLYVGTVSLFGMSYGILMPVLAAKVLQGNAQTLGFLIAATGVGALSGALFLASRRSVIDLERVIPVAGVIASAALISFALKPGFWISMLLLYAIGCGMMVQLASCNTLLQSIIDDDKRGRVMSLHTTMFMGTGPFGSLLVGTLAGAIGTPFTLMLIGVACMLGAGLFASRLPEFSRMVLPVYEKRGIRVGASSDAQT